MRIFWIVMIAAALSLGRLARAADENPPQTDILSAAANTDVILAAVLGNEEDPFASQPAQVPPEWGNQQGNNGGAHFSLDFAYANQYVYRGVDHDAVATHGNLPEPSVRRPAGI